MTGARLTEYEGGFTTSDDGIHVSVRTYEKATGVDLHFTLFGMGIGSASVYHQLAPDEARELAGALEKAAEAAERTAREKVAA